MNICETNLQVYNFTPSIRRPEPPPILLGPAACRLRRPNLTDTQPPTLQSWRTALNDNGVVKQPQTSTVECPQDAVVLAASCNFPIDRVYLCVLKTYPNWFTMCFNNFFYKVVGNCYFLWLNS